MTFAIVTQLINSGYIEVTGFDTADWRDRRAGPHADFTGYMPTSIRFRVPFTDQYTPLIQMRALDGLATMIGMVGEYKELLAPATRTQRLQRRRLLCLLLASLRLWARANSTQRCSRAVPSLNGSVLKRGTTAGQAAEKDASMPGLAISTNLRAFMPRAPLPLQRPAARVGPQLCAHYSCATMQMMRQRLPEPRVPSSTPSHQAIRPMPQALGKPD